MLHGECTAPSPIVGWSPDGYPIKGPCVCTPRDADCTDYQTRALRVGLRGLGAWGDDPGEAAGPRRREPALHDRRRVLRRQQLQLPLLPRARRRRRPRRLDRRVALRPARLLVVHPPLRRPLDSTPAATSSSTSTAATAYEGPGGYAYHATLSFPYIQACYRGVPAEIPAQRHDDDDGGPMEGGMDPPMCMQGQTMMCCGDDVCGGPETAMNCPEDCG
jgi:hypothetical protein